MICIFENISIGPLHIWTGWMPVNEYWTLPELVSVCECQWVSVNYPWTPIECTWMPLSECEHPISAHDHNWVIIECNSPWCDHENDHTCVRIEQPLNSIEWAWTPVSEYWIPLECCWVHMYDLSVCVEHLLNGTECMWMHLSENWTAPENPLSAHECFWVSISKVWMCTYRWSV